MAAPPSEKLTRREREIMNVVFALGNRASAEGIRERGKPRRVLVVGTVGIALMLAVVIAPLEAIDRMQAPTSGSDGPRFDVVSVRQNVSGDLRVIMSISPGGRFTARNVPLGVLIRRAFQLQAFQLEGVPKRLADDRFDIVAQGETSATSEQVRLMLQSLLADRFKLKVHNETRELPLYALVLSRRDRQLGPALTRAEADCSQEPAWDGLGPSNGPPDPDAHCGVVRPAPGGMVQFRGVTLEALTRFLSTPVHRPVVDRTGLNGFFDADFEMTAELGPPPPPPGVPDPFDRASAPSIFTVLQERLGLKLDAQKGPVRLFVIDHVELPTEN